MGCNCNKNKQSTPQEVQSNQQSPQGNNPPQFRQQPIQEQSMVKKKMSMLQSFATAIASRGLADNKVSKAVKQLRVLSCFGNMDSGGVVPPCEHLKESSTAGKYYCGGCGCGDSERTWLISEGEKYSKLDYPKLQCPLSMPGFTNYQSSNDEEGIEPVTRRWYIENKVSYNEIEKIPVSNPTPPQPVEQKPQPQ